MTYGIWFLFYMVCVVVKGTLELNGVIGVLILVEISRELALEDTFIIPSTNG